MSVSVLSLWGQTGESSGLQEGVPAGKVAEEE